MIESGIRDLPTAGLHILASDLKRRIVGNLMLNVGTEQEQIALDSVEIELIKRGEQL